MCLPYNFPQACAKKRVLRCVVPPDLSSPVGNTHTQLQLSFPPLKYQPPYRNITHTLKYFNPPEEYLNPPFKLFPATLTIYFVRTNVGLCDCKVSAKMVRWNSYTGSCNMYVSCRRNYEVAAGSALPSFGEVDIRDMFYDCFPGPIDDSHLDMLTLMMT